LERRFPADQLRVQSRVENLAHKDKKEGSGLPVGDLADKYAFSNPGSGPRSELLLPKLRADSAVFEGAMMIGLNNAAPHYAFTLGVPLQFK